MRMDTRVRAHTVRTVLLANRFLHAIRARIFLVFKRAIKRFHINEFEHMHEHTLTRTCGRDTLACVVPEATRSGVDSHRNASHQENGLNGPAAPGRDIPKHVCAVSQ